MEGLETEGEKRGKACGLICIRCRRGSGGRGAVELANRVDAMRCQPGGELPIGGVMDRPNTGGRIGVGDARASCRSTRGLPISFEGNF